jgi:beta-glucosidase-like glycosyl hydrolase
MTSENSQARTEIPNVSGENAWIEGHIGALSLNQKLAQCLLVMPGVDTDGLPDADTRQALLLGVGVLHSVTDMSASSAAKYHNAVLQLCLEAGLPPALISGNLESGVGYSLGKTGTDFPYPRGIGISEDAELAYRVSRDSAVEARSLGYHWTFSPCVDVIATDGDPILGVRAFGVPTALTNELSAAQIRGYQDGGLLATAKHFPGHGDSRVDSHKDLPRVDRTARDHAEVHMPPFISSIDADVASIMVAHVTLPEQGILGPASLSPTVCRQWLREDLGYAGIIISDSLRMNAIAARHSPAEAALLALQAGADVANVKTPAGEAASIIMTLAAAVRDGELSEASITDSVRRLLGARAALGLHRAKPVDEAAAGALDQPRQWTDPSRRRTASIHDPRPGHFDVLDRHQRFFVVGDTALAARLAELAQKRGIKASFFAAAPTPQAFTQAIDGEDDARVLAVFCPATAMASEERAAIIGAATALESIPLVAAVLVNSTLDASEFADVSGLVLTLPAVDTFGIVSDAAVNAALDLLFDVAVF